MSENLRNFKGLAEGKMMANQITRFNPDKSLMVSSRHKTDNKNEY